MARHELNAAVAELTDDDIYILLVSRPDGNAFIVSNAEDDEAADFMQDTIVMIEEGLLGEPLVSARPT